MSQPVYDTILTTLIDGGMTPDSSADLAFHIALHYPEHGAILIAAHAEPETPQ